MVHLFLKTYIKFLNEQMQKWKMTLDRNIPIINTISDLFVIRKHKALMKYKTCFKNHR